MHVETLEIKEQLENKCTFNRTDFIYETGRANVDKILNNFWNFMEKTIINISNSKPCVIFISTLLSFEKVICESDTNCASELFTEISAAKDILMMNLSTEESLKKLVSKYGVTNISIAPICRIFESSSLKLFIEENSNSPLEVDIPRYKTILSKKIKNFINNLITGTNVIVNLSLSLFTKDRITILTFGYSEIIEILLDNAWKNYNKHYNLLIVLPSKDVSHEDYSVRNQLISYHHSQIKEWKERMKNKGITVSLISIDSIYNAMNIVDFVLLSPECVLENGSVIGISGTAVISSVAKSIFNKPVYIVTHAVKFTNIVPFNIKINNILSDITYQNQKLNSSPITSIVDLSENSHITMFFTDIGVMTPNNISFESKPFVSY